MGYESYLIKTLIWKIKPFFQYSIGFFVVDDDVIENNFKNYTKSSHYCSNIGCIKPPILWLPFENRCDNSVCCRRTDVCVCPDRAKPASFSSRTVSCFVFFSLKHCLFHWYSPTVLLGACRSMPALSQCIAHSGHLSHSAILTAPGHIPQTPTQLLRGSGKGYLCRLC